MRGRAGSMLCRATLLAALALAGATGVEAAPRSCRQLEAALAEASGSGGGGKSLQRKYDRAIAAQRAALDEARARAASCGLGLFGGRCGTLRATIRKMNANLAALESKRAGMGHAPAPRRERARILAALEKGGCRARPAEPARAAHAEKPDEARERHPAPSTARLAGGRGAFCVRTCDGYFFPLPGLAAVGGEIALCEAACPGTPMEVFLRGGSSDPAAMQSMRGGASYRDHPAAFSFRNAAVPTPSGCACNPRKGFAALATPEPNDVSTPTAASGSFDARVFGAPLPAAEPERPAELRPTTAPRRAVRVVGPAFLPDPAAATVPPAPAPSAAPSARP